MGGSLTALSPDFTKAVLGVPGMNYSTLLNRSVDWEGEFIDPANPDIPAYASFNYNAYPDKVEQQLVFAMLQMLWDRGEANGYAHHMTDDPYPNTPPHQVLLEAAFGDYQVTNHSAEVEARTIGANFLQTALAPGRHWERDVATADGTVPFGLTPFARGTRGRQQQHALRPERLGAGVLGLGQPDPVQRQRPARRPRRGPARRPAQHRLVVAGEADVLRRPGSIVDVSDGQPNWTDRCRYDYDGRPAC